jgi:hypothetical protein
MWTIGESARDARGGEDFVRRHPRLHCCAPIDGWIDRRSTRVTPPSEVVSELASDGELGAVRSTRRHGACRRHTKTVPGSTTSVPAGPRRAHVHQAIDSAVFARSEARAAPGAPQSRRAAPPSNRWPDRVREGLHALPLTAWSRSGRRCRGRTDTPPPSAADAHGCSRSHPCGRRTIGRGVRAR